MQRFPWNWRSIGYVALAASAAAWTESNISAADDERPATRARGVAESSIVSRAKYLFFAGDHAGQERNDNALGIRLVWCVPGSYTVQNVVTTTAEEPKQSEEQPDLDYDTTDDAASFEVPAAEIRNVQETIPVKKVFLRHGFWLGKYEVTQSEWKQLMREEPWKGQGSVKEGAEFAASCISWHDAMEFCRMLTLQERDAGRLPPSWEFTLPTEAQWERGCRDYSKSQFSFGNDESRLGEYAWFDGNATLTDENYPHCVGLKKPNSWGLHDMHGNVWEWCRDNYVDFRPIKTLRDAVDPEIANGGELRVTRGGSWRSGADVCRSSNRARYSAGNRSSATGFRVALSLIQPRQSSGTAPGLSR